MAIQYHFLVSCKKNTETEWVMELQAEGKDIPMSVVQPDSTDSAFLTVDAIAQTIGDPVIMTRYLRQLNRRNGRRPVGHNHSVIWNINQRFSQLKVGQKITVKVSYFEPKGLNSGSYEIHSLGVFPPPKSSSDTAEQPLHTSQYQIPQAVVETIVNLMEQVEILKRESHSVQNVLRDHEIRLKEMEGRLQHLEAENRALKEIQTTDRSTEQDYPPQSTSSYDTSDDTQINDEARLMFHRFVRATPSSTTIKESPANYPRRDPKKKS